MNELTTPNRNVLRLALRLEAVSIVWMVAEAAIALMAAIAVRSLLLGAFGLDSLIELLSAACLFYRLHQESAGKATDQALAHLERRISIIGGYLLYLLGLYVVFGAVYGLSHHSQAAPSVWGMGVAIAAALGMPVLARAKMWAADLIGSHALRADAMESLTCGYLAWVLLAGLLSNALLHWWWLDSAASLLIVPILIREGREAIKGEGCGCG